MPWPLFYAPPAPQHIVCQRVETGSCATRPCRNAFASPKPNWRADHGLGYDAKAFPDRRARQRPIRAAGLCLRPREEHDGVTMQLPFTLAQTASSALLDGPCRGCARKCSATCSRAAQIHPPRADALPPKVTEIVREFSAGGNVLSARSRRLPSPPLRAAVKGVRLAAHALPAHLRPRIDIVDDKRKSLGAGRDLAAAPPTPQSGQGRNARRHPIPPHGLRPPNGGNALV